MTVQIDGPSRRERAVLWVILAGTLGLLCVLPAAALWLLWRQDQAPELHVQWVKVVKPDTPTDLVYYVPCVYRSSWAGATDLTCGWERPAWDEDR